MRLLRAAGSAIALASLPAALSAQVIDLTVHDVGLAIGDKPRMTGIRINFRDAHLERVTGANVTIWTPREPATGSVTGLALGVPITGAGRITGVALAPLGVGATTRMSGLGVGGIGIGSGGDLRGIMIGGIGVGSGGSVDGITVGGIGVGSAGRMRGIQIGGIGVGSSGEVTGLSVGGIGVGASGAVRGIAVGGIGVGGAGSFTGIGVGGIGVGTGGDATGVLIGGLGVGAGGTLEGLSIAGIGVGAPSIQGVVLSPGAAGGLNVRALVISGLYFKIAEAGRFDGGALSAVTYIQGAQHGLTIGLFNYARELHGAQVGVINVSDNDGHRRILPLLSIR